MNLTKSALLIAAGLGLSACQGQNPFKRDSNPVRNYPKVANSIEKGDGAVPFGTKPAAEDNSRFACHGPFALSSNSPDGKTVFSFSEGSNLAYEIQILNKLGDAFEASVEGLPKGAEFKLLKQLSVNSAVYQLSWSPQTAHSNSRSSAVLTLKSKLVNERCHNNGTETLNLIVEKVKDRLSLEVTDLPQTEIKFGKSIKFSVAVIDPQATAQAPTLTISFDPVDVTVTTEKLINGADAVDCDKTPKQQNGKWLFACSLNSSALQKDDQDKLLGSGKSAIATFVAQANSRANGKPSNSVKSRVKVLFEKVAAPQVAAAPAPAAQTRERIPLPKERPAAANNTVSNPTSAPRIAPRPTQTGTAGFSND